jgi:DNA-binding NarL/FixJ family response regulator
MPKRSKGDHYARAARGKTHTLRWALRTALKEMSGLEVAGEATNSCELIAQAELLHPDLIVLTWDLPGGPAPRLIAALQTTGTVRIVVLSMDQYVRPEALASGAQEFVCASGPAGELLATLCKLPEYED